MTIRTVLVALLTVALVAGCASSPAREEVEAFIDSTYQADDSRSNTWLSPEPVAQTADTIAAEMDPRDRFTEQGATFMRAREYAVAVFPEETGSRVELDSYDRIYRAYPLFIGGFWGRSPTSYGPRGERASRVGGGFRGGGVGGGK